jgi:site-specific DNA-methyltransferase (adenine-specific)
MPYGLTRAKWDTPIDLDQLWKKLNRVTRKTSAILLFAKTPFDKILGVSNLKNLRYEIIWEKPNATGHLNAKRMPMQAHENILVFYRKSPHYQPEMSSGHERKKAVKRKYTCELYGAQRESSYDSAERYPRSVMKVSSEKQRGAKHPTQKPQELLRKLIRMYSKPGDVVLDFCAGSGSTGKAAIDEGRNFIGIEKDQHWFDFSVKWLNAA